MARLCSCSAKFSLPGKRDLIVVTDEARTNEIHRKDWCAQVWHGRNEHGRYGTLPTPFVFLLLGKATT